MDEKLRRKCAEIFLKQQTQLLDEPVAETVEEAEEFLEDCMFQTFSDWKEARDYLEAEGMDLSDCREEKDLQDVLEVFAIPGGGYFVVEA